ncbi:MAG: restriction endonuclease [Nitrospirae bacterium]|nr:restriction endonuclease [Nitrospirota bacterium]
MDIKVTKASGVVENLNLNKLLSSLTKSGADREQAQDIIDIIVSEIKPYTSTKKIYRLAHKYLRQFNHASGLRYSLKKAIFRLGPSGYPFEKYFGALLENYGYKVKVGVTMDGKCVKHEVDVLAVNENEVSLFECKYRNRPGNTTDVKVAMYVRSRFQDIRPVIKSQYPGKTFKGWLITNTRLTSDAIQYAGCAGLNIKSWSYPDKKSLNEMIEEKRLYPVTIISGIKSGLINSLINRNIILLKDLAEMNVGEIGKMLSLPENKAAALKKQADELCLC